MPETCAASHTHTPADLPQIVSYPCADDPSAGCLNQLTHYALFSRVVFPPLFSRRCFVD